MSYLIFMFLLRQCLGVSNLSPPEGRIVKGYKVAIYEYPYSVFLYFQKYIPSLCGSTLITDRAVITAANCMDEIKYQDGKITAYLGSTVPQNSAVRRHVVLYSIHPRFNPKTGKYNLGIAFFNTHVPLSNTVQKIPIVHKRPQINQALYTTGWGKQNPFKSPDYSDMRHLKASKQRVLSERQCGNVTRSKKTPAFWCTISINGHHYHGDTGNGLVTSYKHLVGVVSYMVNEFTIYSDVLREQLWINNTIIKLLDNFCRNINCSENSTNCPKKIG